MRGLIGQKAAPAAGGRRVAERAGHEADVCGTGRPTSADAVEVSGEEHIGGVGSGKGR